MMQETLLVELGQEQQTMNSSTPNTPLSCWKQQQQYNKLTIQQPQQQLQQQGLQVLSGVAYLPKSPNANRANKIDCGEDAYFIDSKLVGDRVCSLGVADGVGGYQQFGVDPSHMAWALMEGCESQMSHNPELSCKQALCNTYHHIVDNKTVVIGGATACIVSLHNARDDNGNPILRMKSANLGDSAFIVIRNEKVVYRSKDQTHYFNCPYQLSVPTGIGAIQDDPETADEYSFDLMKGDVLIVGTDGLTDNVFDEDIAKIVAMRSRVTSDVNIIAKDILRHAAVRSRTRGIRTPFSDYAQQHNYQYVGGKLDDITIVVSAII
jgi:protein phosphatase PTC7